jgi:hypothetical protein
MDLENERDTIEQETLEGLFDAELGVEDDEAKGDGKGIVRRVVFEKRADGSEGGVVAFSGRIRGQMGASASAGRRLSLVFR